MHWTTSATLCLHSVAHGACKEQYHKQAWPRLHSQLKIRVIFTENFLETCEPSKSAVSLIPPQGMKLKALTSWVWRKQGLHWYTSIKMHLVFPYGHRIWASEHVSSIKSRCFHLCLLWIEFWEKILRLFFGFMYLTSSECAHSQAFRRARNSSDGNFF